MVMVLKTMKYKFTFIYASNYGWVGLIVYIFNIQLICILFNFNFYLINVILCNFQFIFEIFK